MLTEIRESGNGGYWQRKVTEITFREFYALLVHNIQHMAYDYSPKIVKPSSSNGN